MLSVDLIVGYKTLHFISVHTQVIKGRVGGGGKFHKYVCLSEHSADVDQCRKAAH